MAQYTIYQAIKEFTQDFYRKALQPLVAPLIATNTGIETEPLTLRMSQEVSLWATGKFFDTDFTLMIQHDGKVIFEPYQRSKNGRERSPKTYDIGLPPLDKVLQNAAKAKDTFALLAKQWPEENNPEMVAKRKRGFAYQVQESLLPELQYCPNQAQQQQLLKDILKVMVMEKMPHADPAPDHELWGESEAVRAYVRMILKAKLSVSERVQRAQTLYKRNHISMERLTDILQNPKNKALAQDKDIFFLFPCAASAEQLANYAYWVEKFGTFTTPQHSPKPLIFDTKMLENFTHWTNELLRLYGT